MTRPQPIRRAVRHLRESTDNYILVLGLLFTALLMQALIAENQWALTAGRAILVAATLLSFHSARMAPRIHRFVVGMTAVWFVAVLWLSPSALGVALSQIGLVLLLLGSALAILARIALHRRVTLRTVAGALCVYLQLGLAFASIYRLEDQLQPGAVLVTQPTAAVFTYYSFITLTTVGYGDVLPATDVARMTAVFEALIGQIYLVVIVARLVTLLGVEIPLSERQRQRMEHLGEGPVDEEARPPGAGSADPG
jgi:hypothetical protein